MFNTGSCQARIHRSTPFKVLSHLVTLMCATLCVYQVYQLLEQYFKYDVEVQTTIGNIATMTLPTISICPSYSIYGSGSVPREIGNLFKHSAYNYDQRMDCRLTSKNGNLISCTSVTKPEKFLNINYACQSLFHENNELLIDYHSKNFLVIDVNMTDAYNDLYIALYNENQVDMNGDSTGYDQLREPSHDITSYSYIENSFIKLPPPFKSMCVDYNSRHNVSRETLAERCTQKLYYEASPTNCRYDRKCLSGTSSISENDLQYHLNYTIPDVHFGGDLGSPAFQRMQCYKIYKSADCRTREFYLKRTGIAKDYSLRKRKIHRIVFNKPKISGLKLEEVPSLSMGEALSAIAGIINLWSNLAFIDVAFMGMSALKWIVALIARETVVSTETEVPTEIQSNSRPQSSVNQIEILDILDKRLRRARKRLRKAFKRKIRFVTILIYCIIFLICCCHVYTICNLYIEHPFQMEVMLLKKPTFKLKPLSVCTTLSLPSNSTVQDTLDYVNRNQLDNIIDGKMRMSNTTHCKFRKISSIKTSLNQHQVCYSLFLGLKEGVTDLQYKKTLTGDLNKANFKDTYFIHLYVNISYCPNGISLVLHNHANDIDTSLLTDNQRTYRNQLDNNRTIIL